MTKRLKLVLILAVIAVSQIGFLGASTDIQRCRLFMSKMVGHVEDIQEHPGYFETIDICQKLLGLWRGKAILKPSHKLIPIDRARGRQSARNALFGGNDRSFRRDQVDHFADNQKCRIDFFPSLDFQHGESKITLTGSVPRINLFEKSLRTHGDCCWVVFDSMGFRGRRHRILGAQALNSSTKWGMRPDEIRSVYFRPKCQFPQG
ncbi:uncharacterized protein LOC131889807 [Tigriopus californicus]|uniref:uncharacterized protein LOC131889807 n=1 Tax=Tigriopus californicus TaxID=6832 RepID=UPI0027DA368E|nr:uncharacterized protein LOC131889807 [Tigriopus californicus]